jgi:hypothetical protein
LSEIILKADFVEPLQMLVAATPAVMMVEGYGLLDRRRRHLWTGWKTIWARLRQAFPVINRRFEKRLRSL